jgi:hypothetical protein
MKHRRGGGRQTMTKLLKNRWALSTVITTLIILVVSVLLATIVTYFAINVVSTRVQEESLHVSKQHIWLNATATPGTSAYCVASMMVINTGGRDVVLDKISVRGQESPWNQTSIGNEKFVLYAVTTDPISSDLNYVPDFNYTGGVNYKVIGSTQYNFTVANNDLILKSGYSLLLYVINPDSISVNDVGLTVGITLHTAQAMYYRETNIQAVSSS